MSPAQLRLGEPGRVGVRSARLSLGFGQHAPVGSANSAWAGVVLAAAGQVLLELPAQSLVAIAPPPLAVLDLLLGERLLGQALILRVVREDLHVSVPHYLAVGVHGRLGG